MSLSRDATEQRTPLPKDLAAVREEDETTALSVRVGRRRLLPTVLAGVVLVAYAMFLGVHYAPAIVTPDANGYWAQGSLLAETGGTSLEPTSPVQYIGMHWLLEDSGAYFSRYPPGLAVPIAVTCKLLGPESSVALNPLLALLALAGVFLLGRLVAGDWCGLAAALLMALNPTFNRHALTCDAHVAVAALLVWGLYLLLLWGREGRLWQAFGAGLLLGCIPTVRYPEALFALGIIVFLLWHCRARRRIWLHYAVAVAGALVPVVPLMIHNQLAFGAFWRTAYALTNEQTGFSWAYFKQHFVQYLHYLHSDGLGLFFPLALIGFTMMAAAKRSRAAGVLFLLLAVPSLLLYMAYYWAPGGMAQGTMRFLLPTFPLYFLAGLWALATLTRPLSARLRVTVVAILLVMQAIWGGFTMSRELRTIGYQKQVLALATEALSEHVEPGSVVIAHPQIHQHLDFVRRWKLADPTVVRDNPFLDQIDLGEDDQPRPMQAGKRSAQTEKYEGLRPLERERAVAQDMRDWAEGKTIYYLGTEEEIKGMRGSYFHPENFEIIARIKMPERPPDPRREGMMGAAGMPRRPNRDTPAPQDGARSPAQGPGRAGAAQRPAANRPRGRDFLRGGDELVIAKWSYAFRTPTWVPRQRQPLWRRPGR